MKRGNADLMFILLKTADPTIQGSFKFAGGKYTVSDINHNRVSLIANGTYAFAIILTNTSQAGGLRRGFYGIERKTSYPTSHAYKRSLDPSVALHRSRKMQEILMNNPDMDEAVNIFETFDFFDDEADNNRHYIDSHGNSDYLHDLEYYYASDDSYDKWFVNTLWCPFFLLNFLLLCIVLHGMVHCFTI